MMLRIVTVAVFAVALAVALGACGDANSPSQVSAPGEDKTGETRALEMGAALLQGKEPLEAVNVYLDGFHFYNGKMEGQMEAHHYCSKLNEDITQCVIYDGNGKDAKLMGVEYVLSGHMFQKLPEQEKKLWHSHVDEVKSGALIAPGIPERPSASLWKKWSPRTERPGTRGTRTAVTRFLWAALS